LIKKSLLTITILESIKKSKGCPLCYIWLKNEERYMNYLLTNEATMSPEIREKVLIAKGFCNRHMHLLYKTAYGGHTENGLGFALYMQGVIEKIYEEFDILLNYLYKIENPKNITFTKKRKQKKAISSLYDKVIFTIKGEKQCPVCEHLISLDNIYLHTLIQMLNDKNFIEEFKSSNGFCFPHFSSAIEIISKSKLKNQIDIIKTLFEIENKQIQLIKYYLSEFIRKHSWDFRNELPGPEANVNFMLLNILVGVEGLYYQKYKFPLFKK
jgi:hypothetical protein